MANERGQQRREENQSQPQRTSAGQTSATSNRAESGTERGDRERSIQAQRERGRTGLSGSRQSTPQVYGASAGSPFALMRRMADDMDRLFENFGFGRGLGLPSFGSLDRDLWRGGSTFEQSVWSPQVEAFRRGDNIVIRADLPGLKKDDVKVEIDDGMLTISGERREENEENRDDFYRSERRYGQFYRAIPLPEGVSGDQVEGTFKDGVLEVTLPVPKEPERRSKQIPIR